jgi:hypothetical protein
VEELEKAPEAPSVLPADLALVYSRAAAAARADAQLSMPERNARADRYAGRAMAVLKKLQAHGYFQDAGNVGALFTDPDLEALRGRVDFWRLVAELTVLKAPGPKR